MSGLVDLFVRLLAILAAYAIAALAASLFLHVVAWPFIGLEAEVAPWILMGGIFISVPFVALLVAYLAFVPAALLIGLSEILRYRSWVFHALAGAATAFASLALFWQVNPRSADEDALSQVTGQWPLVQTPEAIAAVIAAGIVGGIVYWLVGGRNAGNWLDRRASLASSD